VGPYRVEGADAVVSLSDIPPIDSGAPMPRIWAAEHALELTYYIARGETHDDERVAVIRFQFHFAHFFGPPNEDVLQAHPLSGRGLDWYAGQEVLNSSWIHAMEVANRIHPHHDSKRYLQYRHFIFTFHDSTFECIAKSYQVEERDGEA
jgi:hypothetical protein